MTWEALQSFHFLRPYWLLAILPALVFTIIGWHQSRRQTQWREIIAPELIQHLLTGELSRTQRLPLIALAAAWVLGSIAMAGPAWEKIPQPVHKTEQATVVLLDLSPSMLAEDIKPSRLVRARHKLTDLLSLKQEGITALVAYAGEAHVVTPLTDDTDTIVNLLPALHPSVMPLKGSNTEMAVETALQLFKDAGLTTGNILLVTDGVTPTALKTVTALLSDSAFSLSILGVGSVDGAPIPARQGGFMKDKSGSIVIARLNQTQLQETAAALGGIYSPLRTDDLDINRLSVFSPLADDQTRIMDREFDTWHETGPYLVLLLLPVVLFAFRRGVILSLFICVPLLTAPGAQASFWDDLWLRADQQGQNSFEKGDHEQAARQFKDHRWQGTAHYRNGEYAQSAEAFAQGETSTDHYNRGNALAHQGDLQGAIDAYTKALELDPDMEDAEFNRTLISNIQEQQKQQQNPSSDDKGDQNSSDQQSGGEQNNQTGEQQNTSQSDSEQSGSQQSSSEHSTSQQSDTQQSHAGEQNRQNQSESRQFNQQSGDRQEQQHEQSAAQQAQAEKDEQESTAQQAKQVSEDKQEGSEKNHEPAQSKSTISKSTMDSGTEEQQQALEQWLRQVPDDPSGLIRNKFDFQHRQRRQEYRAGQWEPPENGAYERW